VYKRRPLARAVRGLPAAPQGACGREL